MTLFDYMNKRIIQFVTYAQMHYKLTEEMQALPAH